MITPAKISAAVKRVIAAAAATTPSNIRHDSKLSELGFSVSEKQELAAPLNQEMNRIGYPPPMELHPRHTEIAKTVGNIVSMYRFIYEV
ncbi:MAG: hypothetical protein AAFY31_06425 [Pseudomonadota bacterium]